MQKGKIFFTIDTLQTGGAEKSTLDIVSRLSQEFDITVVVFYNKYDLKKSFEIAGIKLKCFDIDGKYSFNKAIKLFSQLCQSEQPDLVVSTLYRSDIISRIVCKRLKIKIVSNFVSDTYSSSALSRLSYSMKLKIGLFWVLNVFTAKYCYKFLANSHSIKKSNARNLLLDESKIDVIYRGREVSLYKNSLERNTLSAKSQCEFVTVGRLLESKGQLDLLMAYHRVQEKYPNTKLLIAGEGKFRFTLEEYINRNNLQDKVTLLGNINNVGEYLNKCDVFVFPSHYEGFSGAIVEAMLAGIPIVASDIEMNKEAVEHLKSAYLFKVGDIESIEEAMIYAINNSDHMVTMAKDAQKEALKKYDINLIARQHIEFYKTCINS
ncbi:glycosyltransferase [Pontibacter oryzae]|uniref:Glycosyltransferase n=1 Tax=Pontibacter oryzae TaxID=2304593 RepID=A0A399SJW0_9BACT|nr:glycosyltransferase [Pontibacter oryzae]RIJ42773.1 glycosyltransferase [Pontibacter oryzae]